MPGSTHGALARAVKSARNTGQYGQEARGRQLEPTTDLSRLKPFSPIPGLLMPHEVPESRRLSLSCVEANALRVLHVLRADTETRVARIDLARYLCVGTRYYTSLSEHPTGVRGRDTKWLRGREWVIVDHRGSTSDWGGGVRVEGLLHLRLSRVPPHLFPHSLPARMARDALAAAFQSVITASGNDRRCRIVARRGEAAPGRCSLMCNKVAGETDSVPVGVPAVIEHRKWIGGGPLGFPSSCSGHWLRILG